MGVDDDVSPVAGDYLPVEFVFKKDTCELEDSIRTLTDAKYTFGRNANNLDGDTAGRENFDLSEAEKAGATNLWSLCYVDDYENEYPAFECAWPATIVHLSRWQDAAEVGAGCLLDEMEMNGGDEGKGLFLNEKELVLKEFIYIRCPSESGSDNSCETNFSMRLKR
jgi:hypothetical protein